MCEKCDERAEARLEPDAADPSRRTLTIASNEEDREDAKRLNRKLREFCRSEGLDYAMMLVFDESGRVGILFEVPDAIAVSAMVPFVKEVAALLEEYRPRLKADELRKAVSVASDDADDAILTADTLDTEKAAQTGSNEENGGTE